MFTRSHVSLLTVFNPFFFLSVLFSEFNILNSLCIFSFSCTFTDVFSRLCILFLVDRGVIYDWKVVTEQNDTFVQYKIYTVMSRNSPTHEARDRDIELWKLFEPGSAYGEMVKTMRSTGNVANYLEWQDDIPDGDYLATSAHLLLGVSLRILPGSLPLQSTPVCLERFFH